MFLQSVAFYSKAGSSKDPATAEATIWPARRVGEAPHDIPERDGNVYSNCERKVRAGTETGGRSAKQSKEANGASRTTWNAWRAPTAFW